jgi:hypothetical protein
LPGPVCGTADSGPHDDIVPSGPIVTIPSIRRRSGLVTLSGTSRMGPQARPVELLEDVDDTPSSRRPEVFSFPCTSFGVGLRRHTILMTAPIALGCTSRSCREGTAEDIRFFIDVDQLLDLGDDLVLPRFVRRAWADWSLRTRQIEIAR